MAKLPDDTILGGLDSAQSGRPIARLDTSQGAALATQGLQNLGTGLAKLGDAGSDIAVAQTNYQHAQARAQFLTDAAALDDKYSSDTNYQDMRPRYEADLSKIAENAASKIDNPIQRERFTASLGADFIHKAVKIGNYAKSLETDANRGYLIQQGNASIDAAIKAPDEQTRAAFIQNHNDLIDGAVANGYINHVQGIAMKQQWAKDYLTAKAQAAINSGDPAQIDAVLKELNTSPVGGNDVTNRIITIEGRSKNPFSSAEYVGQFLASRYGGDQTWASLLNRYHPELTQGKSLDQINALRADDGLATEMVDKLRQENAAGLTAAGVNATPGAQYLAHFLGLKGATAVLKADPSTSALDALTAAVGPRQAQAMVTANRSILDGKLAGSVAQWADKKMAGVTPGTGSVYDILSPPEREQLKAHAIQMQGALATDSARAIALRNAQIKIVSDQEEGTILKDVYSDNPQISARDVVNNDKLTPETKIRLSALIERVARGEGKDKNTYGPAFIDLFQKVHAADGDPTKITDPATLYQYVGEKGGLTVSGMEKLRNEIASRKTPEGEAVAQMKKQFFAVAHSEISGKNELYKLRDPKGEELFLKFMATSLQAYDAGIKAGKSPMQMLNPDSPDYLGKNIKQFKREPNQFYADLRNASDAPATGTDKIDTTNPQAVIAAVNAGKMTRADGEAIALKNGWIRPNPSPAPAYPVLPMSQ